MDKIININKTEYEQLINYNNSINCNYDILKKRNIYNITYPDVIKFSYCYFEKVNSDSILNNICEKHNIKLKYLLSFITLISKSVNNYIKANELDITEIKKTYTTTTKFNKDIFENINIGEYFYSLDINNAWWQSAYKQGIISKNIYETYLYKPEFKQLKQMSFGLIKGESQKTYYRNGIMVNNIKETKELEQRVYNNIRYLVYNLIQSAKDILKTNNSNYIWVNVDNICILKNDVAIIREYFIQNNWEFKTVICKKITPDSYLAGNEIRFI